MTEINSFRKGITDGMPICLGYLSVAFAFGIFATEKGLSILQALIVSMTNVTSAGQLAGVPIMVAGGTITELMLSQFIINLRYALMSVSLSQKLGKSVRMKDRFVISFMMTDEVFGVASGNGKRVGRNYLFGLIVTPFIGWSLGTLLGAGAGNILPVAVVSALGIAIYAMFVAIVIPEVKKCANTLMCVICAVAIGCVLCFVPAFSFIPEGFRVIIAAGAASAIFAFLKPLEAKGEEDDE